MALIIWIMMIVTAVVQYTVDGVRERIDTSSIAIGGVNGIPLEMSPQILEEPKDEIVRKNDPLTLYCKAQGLPQPTIRWYKGDSETPLRDRDSRLQLPDGSLFFYRFRPKDQGHYFCIAQSIAGKATSRRASLQLAYLRKDFGKRPTGLGVVEGETAVFECDPPKGNPTPIITWRLDGENLKLPRHRFHQEGARLIVSKVVPGDEGEYQCVVTNMADQRISHAAILTIYVAARVGGVVKSMVGVGGHDITIPCVPSGNPEPQVMWRRVGGLMPVGRSSVGRDWSLTISNLITEDQGTYICQATNQVGAHSSNTTLLVVESPRIDGGVRPRIAVIPPNHVRKISCPVSATPSPLIFWVKENHPRDQGSIYDNAGSDDKDKNAWLYPGGQPRILVREEEESSVTLSESTTDATVDPQNTFHVTSQQEGHWACMASNEVGGLMLPVQIIGGGESVGGGTVSMGIVGVDELEARSALLTPTLEQGHTAPISSRSASISWRVLGRPTHLEGLFILGCRRGFGFIPLRVQQQLQTHDITRHRLHQGNSEDINVRHVFQQQKTSSDVFRQKLGQLPRMEFQNDAKDDEWMKILQNTALNDMDPEIPTTFSSNSSQHEQLSASPRCQDLRILGYSLIEDQNTYTLEDLEPYTSYWFLLLPHYKGVLGVPSNMQPFTTPQDVPSGIVILSRWWAARADDGLYIITLHWRHLPPHLSHGIITQYHVMVHEGDTGITHNVSVMGDLTSLTLANVTSSRVTVTLSASTVKGFGPTSPPALLNLLRTHFKETNAPDGMARSVWFIMLAVGSVSMVVLVVFCTVIARWCVRRLHTNLPSDNNKNKMCGGVGPCSEVGGIWAAAVEIDRCLDSDKSERKLLASTASSTADYDEVKEDVKIKIKDDISKSRLDAWSKDLMKSSLTPSRSSVSGHRSSLMTQSYKCPSPRRSYNTSANSSPSNNTIRDSNCDNTWYDTGGEFCSCCHDDIKLMVPPSDGFCSTSSGRTTVLANSKRDSQYHYDESNNYLYSEIENDVYEAVTAYFGETNQSNNEEEDDDICTPSPKHRPIANKESRQMRLNTESTTDLSMDHFNYSDVEDDETQSCSDTEASFFIPHDHLMRNKIRDNSTGRERKTTIDSSFEDIQRPVRERLRSSTGYTAERIPSESHPVHGEGLKTKEQEIAHNKYLSSQKRLKHRIDLDSSTGNLSNPMVGDPSEPMSVKKFSRSPESQDSLEDQFEKNVNMTSQGESCNIEEDYFSTSTYR